MNKKIIILFIILSITYFFNIKSIVAQNIKLNINSTNSYRNIIGLISLEYQANHPKLALKYFKAIEKQIIVRQDYNAATIGGWLYFKIKNYNEAFKWFTLASKWNPTDNDIKYAKALCLFKLKSFYKAKKIAYKIYRHYPKAKDLLVTIILKDATDRYNHGDYIGALKAFDKAQAISKLPYWAQSLKAWCYYHQGQYAEAADVFESLYKKQPNNSNAQGLFLCLLHLKDWSKIENLALAGGPFSAIWINYRAKQAFKREKFLIAKELDPTICSGLLALNGPYGSLSFSFRHKSGDKGTSQLDITRFPILRAHQVFGGVNQLEILVSWVSLDSGSTAGNDIPVGTDPSWVDVSRHYEHTLNYGLQPMIFFYHEARIDTFASFGFTPSHSPLGITPIGNFGFRQRRKNSNWRIAFFRNPVRESILSYVGMKNPRSDTNYSHVAWGRVIEQGLEAGASHSIVPHIGAWIYGAYSELNGIRVVRNRHVQFATGVGYSYSSSIFQYLYVGPYLYWTKYQKNLNHFTFGHGGYFSPSHLINIGLSLNFLTRECRRFQLKGRISLGYEHHREASAPWFPLGQTIYNTKTGEVISHADYSASHSTNLCGSLRLVGLYSLNPNWQLGGGIELRKTGGYNDYTIGFMVRYLIPTTLKCLSPELPEFLLDRMY